MGFFCYVLGTKLGGALPLRMRHKGMQLVLGRLAGHKTDNCQFYSRVSEVTLGPFLGFLCYVLGTKLGAVLPLRMRHKVMQLVLGRLAGNKTEKSHLYPSFNSILFQFYNFILRFQDVRPFFGVLMLRFGHEIGCCFAVADASQSHAACAWQARWPQNGKVNFINFIVGFQK